MIPSRPGALRPALVLLCLGLAAACAPQNTSGELPEDVAGSCNYTNRFSRGVECRDYLGPWTSVSAQADCTDQRGTFTTSERCNTQEALGWCILNKSSTTPTRISFTGGDCATNKRGCEVFGGGEFLAEGKCSGGGDNSEDRLEAPFPEPALSCVDPKDGDAPGAGEGGKVCQWITMQGCTEPGRNWEDYGSCDVPRQQRPYYPVPVAENAERADERLQDPAYAAELTWVKQELSACSCFCCHSNKSPQGPGNWYLEQPGNFVNGMFDTGIAQGAGIIDSTVLGNIPAPQNNGFSRLPSVFPSTNPTRMLAFFQNEFRHRGLREEDFSSIKKYGPLTEQWEFTPQACANGEGVDANGVVTWQGGSARLVYVLEAGSRNPLVPPNLDTPVGTVWRLDAKDATVKLLKSGITYGAAPEGSIQKFPEAGTAPTLIPGTSYLLYVAADYVTPITRCLFTR